MRNDKPHLFIPMTRISPLIDINTTDGIVEITGRSVPEDAIGFYKPILEMFNSASWRCNKITFIIQLEYIGTQSTRMLFRLLQMADVLHNRKSINASVLWYCEEEDEGLIQDAEDFKDLLNAPFEIVILNAKEYDLKMDIARQKTNHQTTKS